MFNLSSKPIKYSSIHLVAKLVNLSNADPRRQQLWLHAIKEGPLVDWLNAQPLFVLSHFQPVSEHGCTGHSKHIF